VSFSLAGLSLYWLCAVVVAHVAWLVRFPLRGWAIFSPLFVETLLALPSSMAYFVIFYVSFFALHVGGMSSCETQPVCVSSLLQSLLRTLTLLDAMCVGCFLRPCFLPLLFSGTVHVFNRVLFGFFPHFEDRHQGLISCGLSGLRPFSIDCQRVASLNMFSDNTLLIDV